MADKKPRIVIVGAGFGGVKLAKLFAKDDVEITLVDRHNSGRIPMWNSSWQRHRALTSPAMFC